MIEENLVRVHWQEAMEPLKNRLNGYRGSGVEVYIGATSDPERRFARHRRDGWTRMILVYEAYTPAIAAELEQNLIDYARRCRFIVPILNLGDGGEGLTDERRSNWIYFLLR